MNPLKCVQAQFHEEPENEPTISMLFGPHGREDLGGRLKSVPGVDHALGREQLKQMYLAGLEDALSAAGTSLRPIVEALLRLGVTRGSLVDWAVAAGYSKAYVRSVLSRIIVATGRRERKPGPGRRTSQEALLVLAFARERFGARAPKHLLAAYRAAKREDAASALQGQAATRVLPNESTLKHEPPTQLCHRNKYSGTLVNVRGADRDRQKI